MVIEKFLLENFLKLKCDKCEILVHSSGNSTPDITVNVGLHSLKPVTASRCLGTWWTSDLIPHKAIAGTLLRLAEPSLHMVALVPSMVTLILCQPEEVLKSV